MKTVFSLPRAAFPIKLEAYRGAKLFRVTYGLQVRDKLSYSDAARELGAASGTGKSARPIASVRITSHARLVCAPRGQRNEV
jgi:hypothetical protein